MRHTKLEKLALELGESDEMLVVEENNDKDSLEKTNGKGKYVIIDQAGNVYREEETKDVIGRKVVGYVNLEERMYFDGETLNGAPYAIAGRNKRINFQVRGFFEQRKWEINSK